MAPDVEAGQEPQEEAPPEEAQGQEEEKPPEETPEEEGEPKDEEGEGGEEKPAEEAEAKASEPAEAEEKRKRAGGWQRKIERLERQNDLLLQQLQTQRPNGAQPAPEPGKEKTPAEKAQEWIDQRVEERLAAREQARQAQTAQLDFQRRTAEVRAQNADFDDVVMSASDIPVSPAVQEALLTSEHGPAIMYQLAKSPAELARISALPPLNAAREIGRLEAKLSSSTPAPKTQKPAMRPPAPPTNVSGSTSNTRSLDDLPISDYKRAYRSGRR